MSGFSPATDPFPILSGGQPNWLAGYVPSAQEWNHEWSSKADIDDPRLAGGPFLPLTGGTMVGELTLAGPPAHPLDAATKAYVDAISPVSGPFLPMSGGTMTGVLTLASNPTGPLDAAPRQYVDAVGTTANQALSVAQAAVPRTGATMTGPLVLSQNPSAPLGAATKAYVDGFLPLSGGNVSGNVSVAADVYANRMFPGSLAINSFNNWEWTFSVDANGDKSETYRAGWVNYWDARTGQRVWSSPSGGLMTLDGSGALWLLGGATVGGTGVNYSALGTDHVAFGWSSVITAYVNGNFVGDLAVTSYVENRLNSFLPIAGGTITGALTANGGITISNGFTLYGPGNCTNDLQVGRYITVANHGQIGDSGWYYTGSTGGAHGFQIGFSSPNLYVRMDNNTDINIGVSSDERLKQDIAPSTFDCLDVIRRTQLYQFRYLTFGTGEDEGKLFSAADDAPLVPVGFVAQRMQEIFPASVAGEATLSINVQTVVAALVGAVQELAARVEKLGPA